MEACDQNDLKHEFKESRWINEIMQNGPEKGLIKLAQIVDSFDTQMSDSSILIV